MDKSKFDVILDAGDSDFAQHLMKALGVKPGDTLNIVTPQFDRTDGREVVYIPTTDREYMALPALPSVELKRIGCQIWDSENGRTHWLYPAEWYDHIPAGTPVISISGECEAFEPGKTDNGKRFGALAYGFTQTEH